MIGKLTGTIDTIEKDNLTIDVNGVGYIVFVNIKLLQSLSCGQKTSLYTHMQVKEDDISLFGFASLLEREWFRILKSVQGVGGKAALTILGGISIEELETSIIMEDKSALQKISGIGPKLAARIVNELKGKVMGKGLEVAYAGTTDIISDAVSALVNIGFNRTEAYKVANDLHNEDEAQELEGLIKNCLTRLGSYPK